MPERCVNTRARGKAVAPRGSWRAAAPPQSARGATPNGRFSLYRWLMLCHFPGARRAVPIARPKDGAPLQVPPVGCQVSQCRGRSPCALHASAPCRAFCAWRDGHLLHDSRAFRSTLGGHPPFRVRVRRHFSPGDCTTPVKGTLPAEWHRGSEDAQWRRAGPEATSARGVAHDDRTLHLRNGSRDEPVAPGESGGRRFRLEAIP